MPKKASRCPYMCEAPPACRRLSWENRTPDAPPPSIPSDGMSFCLSQCYSNRSGTDFRNDNYIRVQGGTDGALAASERPSQHTHVHLFYTPPHLLPSMDPYADRNTPSSLGRVAFAKNITNMLTLLDDDYRAARHTA